MYEIIGADAPYSEFDYDTCVSPSGVYTVFIRAPLGVDLPPQAIDTATSSCHK
ncbi:MAG TPA: hypothetical protein V6D25_30265 [Leptolyngbyaceae cyanobacterium]